MPMLFNIEEDPKTLNEATASRDDFLERDYK